MYLRSSGDAPTSAADVLAMSAFLQSGDFGNAPLGELVDPANLDAADRRELARFRSSSRLLARELGFKAGQLGVVINGRVRVVFGERADEQLT